MKTTLLKNILTFCLVVCSVGALTAQVNNTWTGTTDTDFGTATNWDLGTVPLPEHDVIIAPSSNSPVLSVALSTLTDTPNTLDYITHLILQADSELTIAAKLWIYAGSGNYFGSGTLNVEEGADINIRNQGRFGGDAASTQIVNINGGLVNTKNQLIIGDAGDCTFNVNGGTVTSTTNGLLLGNYNGNGTLNINGGITTFNAIDIDEQPSRPGTGIIVIGEGTLEITDAALQAKIDGYVTGGKIVAATGKTLSVVTDYLAGKITITATGGLSVNDNSKVSTEVYAMGDRVYVSNVKSASEITIYSITGALVKTLKTNNETSFTLKSGLYIGTVKTFEGQKSVKLLTK